MHAFDRDPDAIAAGEAMEDEVDPPRLVLHPHALSEMRKS